MNASGNGYPCFQAFLLLPSSIKPSVRRHNVTTSKQGHLDPGHHSHSSLPESSKAVTLPITGATEEGDGESWVPEARTGLWSHSGLCMLLPLSDAVSHLSCPCQTQARSFPQHLLASSLHTKTSSKNQEGALLCHVTSDSETKAYSIAPDKSLHAITQACLLQTIASKQGNSQNITILLYSRHSEPSCTELCELGQERTCPGSHMFRGLWSTRCRWVATFSSQSRISFAAFVMSLFFCP